MNKERFMKNGVFSLEYDKETLTDLCLELQEENKKQQEVIDRMKEEVKDQYRNGLIAESTKIIILDILKEVSE